MMSETVLTPNEELLDAFECKEEATLLVGGEGRSYLAGEVVLKPIDNIEEANWVADLMNTIVENGFRVPKPVRAKNGNWVYRNWTAFKYLEGEASKQRAKEKFEVARKFNKVLASCKRPVFLETKINPYVTADRMVWGKQLLTMSDQLKPFLTPIVAKLKPIELEEQLIHGDMAGNILFHETLPPAVIDMTPYWHPAKYAEAIIVVDAIVWDGADDTLLEMLDNTFEMNQLMLRAAIWRIKITDEFFLEGEKKDLDFENYRHFFELLLGRMKT
jgi:uncharacterized protein (TIGR02569 family)